MKLIVPMLFLLLPIFSFAQEVKPRPSYGAVRAWVAPVVDGDLSDAVWSTAPEITGFTQRDPNEGQPATQQTKLKVAYDDDAIYFGALMEDAGPVTPLLARRDSDLNNGDYIRISIDSQHDRLNGAAFVVNASNVQMDMILYNDIYDDISWDAVWSSATKIGPHGWTAELRIPYSQLRFPEKDIHTWGLNVSRWQARLRESSRLVFTPKTESVFVSKFADLTGITGIKPKRRFEVMPYGVARTDLRSRADNPFVPASDHRLDGGVDLKYGLTSSLTLSGTINPDFGQVEVDPAVLNLSQFETFFPEKRPFFTEGADVFKFGNGPANSRWGFNMSFPTFFYSRRIGRAPQAGIDADYMDAPGETTILGAAKVTGKVGKKWTVGILDALTDKEKGWYSTGLTVGTETVEPMTNYLVARATREYGKDSRAGFMFTSVNRRLSDNLEPSLRQSAYFAGADGYTLLKDKKWIVEWLAGSSLVEGSADAIAATQRNGARYYQRPDAGHVEYDPTRTSLTGWMSRAMLSKQQGKWRPNLQVQVLSPGLEINDVGFLPRTDAISTHALVHYVDTDVKKHYRELTGWVGKFQNWNFDGDTTANGVASNFNMMLKSYWSVYMWAGKRWNAFDDRATRGGPAMLNRGNEYVGGGFNSDSRKKYSMAIETERWTSVDGSAGNFLWSSFTYRPSPSIRLSLTPMYDQAREAVQYVSTVDDPAYAATYGKRYVFSQLDRKTLDIGIRTEWTASARLSMQLYLQPFVASGDYSRFKYLTRARDDEFTPLGDAQADAEVGSPDFNFRSVRGSAVVRWEFRPGSAMYVVWNENRSGVAGVGDFRFGRDFRSLVDAASQDVFLVKFSYWLPM
ncbi:MAG TPA: DUF5916 domain-containing protein [Thermoanaerobaculia bacterium]|nr:DUF5916 domain-containing protein [Thermoanaerobaculia bacterium]